MKQIDFNSAYLKNLWNTNRSTLSACSLLRTGRRVHARSSSAETLISTERKIATINWMIRKLTACKLNLAIAPKEHCRNSGRGRKILATEPPNRLYHSDDTESEVINPLINYLYVTRRIVQRGEVLLTYIRLQSEAIFAKPSTFYKDSPDRQLREYF